MIKPKLFRNRIICIPQSLHLAADQQQILQASHTFNRPILQNNNLICSSQNGFPMTDDQTGGITLVGKNPIPKHLFSLNIQSTGGIIQQYEAWRTSMRGCQL